MQINYSRDSQKNTLSNSAKTTTDQSNSTPKPQASNFQKGIRIDLSSMDLSGTEQEIEQIINNLKSNHVNTLYLNPWSDGQANYKSQIIPTNNLGDADFFNHIIDQAHQNQIQVHAWFVVGKDNFSPLRNPQWFAITASGQNYHQQDEPGISLPFASIANPDYKNYHLSLIEEVSTNSNIDGWVISEPLIGWGDLYDDYYTDFSHPAIAEFISQTGLNPINQVNSWRDQPDQNYQLWIKTRVNIVTSFIESTVSTIKKSSPNLLITLTLFVEPNQTSQLDFDNPTEAWGEDISKLIQLDIDQIELQAAFSDFHYPQPPTWVENMINSFKSQYPQSPPISVSVQSYPSAQTGEPVTPSQFKTGLESAQKAGIIGLSTYAYHRLSPDLWGILNQTYAQEIILE